GGPVAGEAITGTWWAYPVEAGAKLTGYPPSVVITMGSTVTVDLPEAPLVLGAYAPAATIQQDATVTITSTPGVLLGKYVPALNVSSTISWGRPGLLLGTITFRFYGQEWLYDSIASDLDLALSACTDLDLVASAAAEIDLVPSTCR